jgi:hypothetical protein
MAGRLGELIRVDVTKFDNIPGGGGHTQPTGQCEPTWVDVGQLHGSPTLAVARGLHEYSP